MKKLILSIAVAAFAFISTPASAQMTEGQGALVGGIIGYMIGKHNSPQPVYAQQPAYSQPQAQVVQQPYVVSQPPVVVQQPYVTGYNPTLHGYCAGYKNELYYQCLGNRQRQLNEEAYYRGLNGIR